MLSSSCPEPQGWHARERDACPRQQGTVSRPFGSSQAMGHVRSGGVGTGCLGMSSEPWAAASTRAAVSRPTGLKPSCAWTPDWQHLGGCPLSPTGARRAAGAGQGVPVPAQPHPGHPGGPDPASLPAVFACRWPWLSPRLVTGCPGRRGQRSAQHVAARFVHPQPFNYVPFSTRAVKRAGERPPAAAGTFCQRVGSGADPARATGRVLGYAWRGLQRAPCVCCYGRVGDAGKKSLPKPGAAQVGTQRCPVQGQTVPRAAVRCLGSSGTLALCFG